ncbi:amidohydrolase [Ruoffia tabacinasalis]|uniref:M20 metallopeptidase family protein n=1 Tax=Ruoffia tabacinasalis TaxID=87458 RepID=UPI0030D4BE15
MNVETIIKQRTDWLYQAKVVEEDVIKIRRHLHQYPELSFQEEKTSDFVYQQLRSYGITDIQRNVGNGYGIVAKIHGHNEGPVIALRADMDALPITEETQLDFKSIHNGVMHACGHDAHTAMLLGVARIMNRFRFDFSGTIVFIFQNAEESQPGGAKSMIEDGALDDVDSIYGLHVVPEHCVGSVGYSLDYGSASSDTFEIKIQGRGGHGAKPHQSLDSVIIASEIITTLQSIVSRYIDPIHPAVLTFASVNAGGGVAINIIADQAVISGTVRTFSEEIRQVVKRKFHQMINAIANMHDSTANIFYRDGYPALLNTKELVERAIEQVQQTQLFDNIVEIGPMTGAAMIGEDFAYYLKEVPGAFLNIGVKGIDKEESYPLHHPKFELDEQGLLKGIEVYLTILMHQLGGVDI